MFVYIPNLFLSLYLGLQKPNGMWINLCAVLLNIFVIFFSCVFVIVVAFVLYFLSWPQEPTGVWVSVLIGDQAVFHKEVFTDGCLCVYIQIQIYLCVSVRTISSCLSWSWSLSVSLFLTLYSPFFLYTYIHIYFYIFGLEGSGTNWRVSEWAVS